MKNLSVTKILLLLTSFVILSSCSRVTWASFTTPKDNVQNIPNGLNFLGIKSLDNVRIFEFDKDKYMGVYIYKNTGSVSTKQQDVLEQKSGLKIIMPTQVSTSKIEANKLVNKQMGNLNLVQYFPNIDEDEIVTANYVMQAINGLKKNRKVEVYSQSGSSLQRSFTIIYK